MDELGEFFVGRTVPADPRATALMHDRFQGGDQSARGLAPSRLTC